MATSCQPWVAAHIQGQQPSRPLGEEKQMAKEEAEGVYGCTWNFIGSPLGIKRGAEAGSHPSKPEVCCHPVIVDSTPAGKPPPRTVSHVFPLGEVLTATLRHLALAGLSGHIPSLGRLAATAKEPDQAGARPRSDSPEEPHIWVTLPWASFSHSLMVADQRPGWARSE